MSALPFALRRPWLLVRDLLADRERPDLGALGAIRDPEGFVWAILPHAARTFSACIALLPAPAARACAVAYLYCRILDTYEDLSPTLQQRVAALQAFAKRFDAATTDGRPPPAPPLADDLARDARDRAHLLLVSRCDRVDGMYAGLPGEVRGIIRELVQDMAEGMRWGAQTLADQGEVLHDDAQLLRYCRAVLGNPVLFVTRLSRLRQTGDATLSDEEREAAMLSGEFIQLANVTRDIEKDLLRGLAFHPLLAEDLGAPPADDEAAERVRRVREHLLRLALLRAPAYTRLVAALDHSTFSLTRASALLMLRFTDRYYRGCAARVGRRPWGPRASGAALLVGALPAILSRAFTRRTVTRSVDAMLAGARDLQAIHEPARA